MKHYLLLILLLLVPAVTAYEDGTIYTQRDIDRINVDIITNETLDCHKETLRLNTPTFAYSCQTITQLNDTHYQVVREEQLKQFASNTVYIYLSRESLQNIINITKNLISLHVTDTVEETKSTIRSYQSSRTIRLYKQWIYTYNPFA